MPIDIVSTFLVPGLFPASGDAASAMRLFDGEGVWVLYKLAAWGAVAPESDAVATCLDAVATGRGGPCPILAIPLICEGSVFPNPAERSAPLTMAK